MKKLLLSLIRFYQKSISPAFPARCRYYPTCSRYAYEAITKYGALKGGMDRPGACHNHNVPAALECFLVEAVDFTQSSADTVAHIGFPQLFADGNAHPIGGSAVASGIQHQMAVGLSVCLVKTLEYVVEL